ncbi:MAG: sugar phosphate isomerase/epimerase [Alphaproteobacteria bacterium]|nr:sugar phosphate isomerase/epimerase [Alphaproteobacteria bacterium]
MNADPVLRVPPESLLPRGIGRAEFFDLGEDELADPVPLFEAMAAEERHRYSFHAPIARPSWFPFSGVTCFFLCEDPERRELSFRLLGHTLDHARSLRADYVVCHLTFGPTDTRDEALARRLADDACARLAGMSRSSGVPIDLEFAAYTDSYHRPDLFASAVGSHPELGVCIDIAHTFIGSRRRERDYWRDLAVLAPGARSMHLWNTRGADDARANGHQALHPSQRPGDGWIDVERALDTVLGVSPKAALIFEYPVAAVTAHIREGYDWIEDHVKQTMGTR